jgi:hypothetical protein
VVQLISRSGALRTDHATFPGSDIRIYAFTNVVLYFCHGAVNQYIPATPQTAQLLSLYTAILLSQEKNSS